MRLSARVLALGLSVAGCAAVERVGSVDEGVEYRCAGGESFRARLSGSSARLRFAGQDDEVELQRIPSASGEKFSDGKSTLWIKGAEAYVERSGRPASFGCRAIP